MNTKQLKNKILDLAIRGQLVEQDPSDEPAQVLLERIINEKTSMITDKKKKKTTHKNPYQNEEEFPFEIPQNWTWCKGEDIFYPMKSQKPEGDFFRYIDITSIDNKKHKIVEPKIISVSEAPSRASRKLNFGDTIFSMVRPYLENIAFIDEDYSDCIASTGFFVCSPNGALFPKFLFYLMTSKYVIDGLNGFMKGDNSPSINNENITKFPFPLPPLSEQRRIVSKIEEIFALIDELEINKTDLQTLIKQTKTKVLDLAIRGKLLNEENALSFEEATSDNGHYNDFPFPIPKHWQWKKLGEVFKIIMGQSPKGENVSESGKMEFHQGKIFFTSKYLNLSNIYTNQVTKIAPANSVLLCVRAPVGEVNITKREICIGRGLCSIVPQDKMSSKFVYYWLLTLKENFERKATGSTFASISMDIIKNEKIPLPPLSEQEKIVQKIEKIFSELEKIETMING